MTVIYNTNFTHNPNSYLTLCVERAAQAVFGHDNVVVAENMSLAEIAASGEHDTLICLDAQRLNLPLIRRVRTSFKTLILWTFEDPFMLDFNVNNAAIFDYVFTNDPSCAAHYQKRGHYLPLAASASIHKRPIKSVKDLDYDICFAGTMWPNRVKTLQMIVAAFPEARMKLICPGNPYLPPLPADLAALAIQRPVSHESFIDFANASAVTLTMFRDYASHGDVSQATAPGPRFYELGLAGTAQVIEAPDAMDMQYFSDVEGISVVRDAHGMVNAVHDLLENETRRQRAARAAQESVLSAHLYEHRLKEIADLTGANFKRHVTPTEIAPRRGKMRVLMCTHSTIFEKDWGGVEVYQQTLCASLGREIEFFYWLRRGTVCRLTTANGREIEQHDVEEINWTDALCDAAEERAFSQVIGRHNIDIVHIQHLGHHALSLPIIAKACGTGVVFSAHDFWLISSRYNLLNQDLRFDEGQVRSVLASDIIHKITDNVAYGGDQTRRAFVSMMLRSVDAILFGTEYSRNLTHEIYPVLDDKRSCVYGVPSPETTFPVTPKSYAPLEGRPLGVAIIGNFLRTKGADAIINLLEIAHPEHFEFHIFGYIHPDYEAVVRGLNRDNVKFYGRYNAGDISALTVADVALNLSIWPETYCISLSEAWQSGLIPVVTDVGALGDRVEDGVNGFKVPIGRPDVVLERLELLRSSEYMRKDIMQNITPALWVTASDYAEKMRTLYHDIAPLRPLGTAELQVDAGQLHILPHKSWRHQAPPRHIFDPPTQHDLMIELPEPVMDWVGIQGAEYYVDDVCHRVLSRSGLETFQPADEFHIRGWYVLPDCNSSGAIYTALISQDDDTVIFVSCSREARGDVTAFLPNAPLRSGFSGKAALRGKWCEGAFRIGLVNIVNGAASFLLTPIIIEVKGAKVISLRNQIPENEVVLNSFDRVAGRDGVLRGIKLDRLMQRKWYFESAEFLFFIDAFADLLGQEGDATDNLPSAQFFTRGWGFMRRFDRAGDMFLALVSRDGAQVIFFGLQRAPRLDVQNEFNEAPLSVGFQGHIDLEAGYYSDLTGLYDVCLVNTIGTSYGLKAISIELELKENKLVQSRYRSLTPEDEARFEGAIRQRIEKQDGLTW
ncbi:Glycosyltransferase [Acetobacteraceae bacterium EV16G]